jgi:hypothetical protein
MTARRLARSARFFTPSRLLPGVLIAFLGLFIWVGFRQLRAVEPPPAFTAKTELAPNHRITVRDLNAPSNALLPALKTLNDFEGRYLSHRVKNGEKVDYGNTQPLPSLPINFSIGWVPLKNLPEPDMASIDVGTFVEICNLRTKHACGAIPVEAVVCQGASAPANCWAALRLTDDRRRSFVTLANNGSAPVISVLTHDKGDQRCVNSNLSRLTRTKWKQTRPASGPSSKTSSKVPRCF